MSQLNLFEPSEAKNNCTAVVLRSQYFHQYTWWTEEMYRTGDLRDHPKYYYLEWRFPGEEFRDIEGYEGNYSVSSWARVLSWHRNAVRRIGCNTGGYLQAKLSYKGESKSLLLNRIVCSHFGNLEMDDKSMVANHINFNIKDNRARNLEPITQRKNVWHSVMAGRFTGRNVKTKPIVQIILSEKKIIKFESIALAARLSDASRPAIKNSLARKTKCGRKYNWMYQEDYDTLTKGMHQDIIWQELSRMFPANKSGIDNHQSRKVVRLINGETTVFGSHREAGRAEGKKNNADISWAIKKGRAFNGALWFEIQDFEAKYGSLSYEKKYLLG